MTDKITPQTTQELIDWCGKTFYGEFALDVPILEITDHLGHLKKLLEEHNDKP